MTQRGFQHKNFYLMEFVHWSAVLACIGPMAITVCPSLAEFIKKLNKFANISI